MTTSHDDCDELDTEDSGDSFLFGTENVAWLRWSVIEVQVLTDDQRWDCCFDAVAQLGIDESQKPIEVIADVFLKLEDWLPNRKGKFASPLRGGYIDSPKVLSLFAILAKHCGADRFSIHFALETRYQRGYVAAQHSAMSSFMEALREQDEAIRGPKRQAGTASGEARRWLASEKQAEVEAMAQRFLDNGKSPKDIAVLICSRKGFSRSTVDRLLKKFREKLRHEHRS